jgi:hypothetical protein
MVSCGPFTHGTDGAGVWPDGRNLGVWFERETRNVQSLKFKVQSSERGAKDNQIGSPPGRG